MKKIMFSEEYGLEQAVLKLLDPEAYEWERKYITRRVAHPTRNKELHEIYKSFKEDGKSTIIDLNEYDNIHLIIDGDEIYEPEYKVGEVVAIAQRYKDLKLNEDFGIKERATDVLSKTKGWTNKMYVRADLMPYRIRITGIKGERLQDISERDCRREGIVKKLLPGTPTEDDKYPCAIEKYYYKKNGEKVYFDTAREAFASLINGTSHKNVWEKNPWVFVYEFVLC